MPIRTVSRFSSGFQYDLVNAIGVPNWRKLLLKVFRQRPPVLESPVADSKLGNPVRNRLSFLSTAAITSAFTWQMVIVTFVWFPCLVCLAIPLTRASLIVIASVRRPGTASRTYKLN